MKRLEGRTALVFGAGSSGPGWGNGKAAAVLYAREGGRVACVDMRAAAADETADIIAGEGGTALAFAADVTDEDAVSRVVADVLARWDRVDVLHNNVGVTDMGPLTEIDSRRWAHVMEVNLGSAVRTCRAVLPAMLRQRKGAIVNISSLAGATINAYPYFSYYASKAGLNHFTRALAVQHAADGVRANVVMPGVMDTPLIHRQIAGQYDDTESMLRARHAMSPMKRMGDAWDVARASLFLASDEAAYVTGVCLPVDGGLSCLATC